VIDPNLPRDFYTEAYLFTPNTKIIVNQAMFWSIFVVEIIILLFVSGVLIWFFWINAEIPETSSYSLLEFALKTKYDFPTRKP
jgi:hypothetical protein